MEKLPIEPRTPPMNIHQSMVKIMRSVEAIKKEKTSTSQGSGFKYRGIDDVMNSLHESFAENNVFITTDVLNRVEVERLSGKGNPLFYVTITVRFTFNAEDGSSISSTIYGTSMDSGDKADNKCMSIALKYALLQSFLIPTEEMIDPDKESHEVKPEVKQPAKSLIVMTDEVWVKYVARLSGGELLADKIRKAFKLTPEQDQTLKAFEGGTKQNDAIIIQESNKINYPKIF